MRGTFFNLILFVLVLLMLTQALSVGASGARELIDSGNRAYEEGNMAMALELYEKASIDHPESAEIAYNKAVVLYVNGEYLKAAEGFSESALKTKDLSLEARAIHNRGNCLFMEAQKQQQDDLQKAVDIYQASISSYERALELDSELDNAAHNLEVARLVLKNLLDEMKKREQEAQQQAQQLKEIVETLKALIDEQSSEISRTEQIIEKKEKSTVEGYPEEVFDEVLEEVKINVEELAVDQDATAQITRDLSTEMEKYSQDQSQGEETNPLSEAKEHVDSAVIEQRISVEYLHSEALADALPAQNKALGELEEALKILTEQQQPQTDNQQEEQSQAERPQESGQNGDRQGTESAQDILREEMENRRNTERAERTELQDVDKDW